MKLRNKFNKVITSFAIFAAITSTTITVSAFVNNNNQAIEPRYIEDSERVNLNISERTKGILETIGTQNEVRKIDNELMRKSIELDLFESELKSREESIEKMEKNISKKEVKINKKEAELQNKQLEIKTQNDTVDKKEENLKRRDALLLIKEKEIKKREDSVKQKENELIEKENELNKKEKDIELQNQSLEKKISMKSYSSSKNTKITYTEEDYLNLCRIVYHEANNQGLEGMRLVANVVINRSLKNNCSITDTLNANKQFIRTDDPGMTSIIPNELNKQAANEALKGIDKSNGALFFCTPEAYKRSSYFQSLEFLFQYKGHIFCK